MPQKTSVRSIARSMARVLVGLAWTVLIVVATSAALEGYLAFKWGYLKPRRRAFLKQHAVSTQPKFKRIEKAYYPFAVQHINPYYLFFFPFDQAERASINNDVCSIGPEGFRGPGPEAAGDRKLAFVLGGSTVFGHYASSDSTTIPGYLNSLQSEYFFVNAGVPSWNSLQELYRLAFQVLDYHPDLVIAYDGGNDIALTCMYWKKGLNYPAGTPESFDKLYALVGDIRGHRKSESVRPLFGRLFPRLSKAVGARLRHQPETRQKTSLAGLPDALIRATTDRYLSNLEHMQAMTQASGARFISVFHPIGRLHANVPANLRSDPAAPAKYTRMFRDQVFSTPTTLVEHLDYSTFFEKLGGTLPWLDQPGYPDLSPDVVFIDGFHLNDIGNRMVAEGILEYLHSSSPKK